MIKSLTFWTLVAGLVAYVVKYFVPTMPIDATAILTAILFLLSLFGITPTFRLMTAWTDIFHKKEFWLAVVALAGFVIHYVSPTFPFENDVLFILVVYILGLFGITPELKLRGLK